MFNVAVLISPFLLAPMLLPGNADMMLSVTSQADF